MTINLFLILFTILSAVSTLLTEAIKKATSDKFANNLIALIVSVVAGGGGTAAAYIWTDTPFNTNNVLALVCMALAVWIGCQIGFDKVKQLITQIQNK